MFSEISLHILDIVQNSIKAGADFVEISLFVCTVTSRLQLTVQDNGCGMNKEQLAHCINPFFTTRTTRRVGLGIPFLKQSAECTGGTFTIISEEGAGTRITADYHMDHIDCIPLGDINATIYSLIIMNKERDFYYRYRVDEREFILDTRQIKEIMGEISVETPEVAFFLRTYLDENKKEVDCENIII